MPILSLGGLTLYPYGLSLAVAALLSLLLAGSRMRKAGCPAGTLSWFTVLALPLGVLMARLGYCLIRFGWFTQKGWGWFFQLQEGGFVLYGALLGCLLAASLTSRFTGVKLGKLTDALSAPAALMIGLSRLAEGLVNEGYGWDMETWFAEEGMSLLHLDDPQGLFFFPLGHYREAWDTWYWAVYVLEGLIALGICLWLLLRKPKKTGEQTLVFLLLYAAGQALCESMRQDSVLRWGFVRVSQLLSALVVAGVLLYWCLHARPGETKAIVRSWIGTLACVLVVIAMEFGVEKKIVFLEWMPVSACYLVMAAACAGLVAFILPMAKRQRPE